MTCGKNAKSFKKMKLTSEQNVMIEVPNVLIPLENVLGSI